MSNSEEQNKTEFLKNLLPFYDKISEESREKLTTFSHIHFFKKGTILQTDSESCAGLFLILSGKIRVYTASDKGKEISLYYLSERDMCIFSSSCMMKNINFDIFISAEEDTDILLIPSKKYKELSEKEISISNYTNELLSSRFSDVMYVLEQILFMSFDKRLAIFLLDEMTNHQNDTLTITHEEIAKHLGSAREVVSRMLKYFESENILTLNRGKIKITDIQKLNKLAKND